MSACPRPEKVAYANHWLAAAARRRIRQQEGWRMDAYRCRCGAFHLTNPRKGLVAFLEAEDRPPRYRNTPAARRVA